MAPQDRTPSAAREERQWAGAPFDADSLPGTVWEALLVARDRHGGGKIILEDHDRVPLTYDALLAAAGAIAIKLREIVAPGSAVGVMLPTSVGGATLFLALQAATLIPTMLNYAAGADKVRTACALAEVRHVLSSRRFVEEGHYQSLIETLAPDFAVIWAEDLRDSVGPLDLLRIGAELRERRPANPPSSNAPATILFTSGTTGAPKGVILSHRNIIANLEQCRRHGFFDPDWVFFNSLPLFHAFGLVAGTLLPLINGSKAVLYPSPLRYAQIVQLVEATKPSVLVSTDTFARQYARAATHRELASLKYLVLGAEPLRAETLALWRQVSDAQLLEGYGATECSPVIAFNPPGASRLGAVGTILPGMEARLQPVAGIEEGGQLFVRGPNVMRGYLGSAGSSGLSDGWFDTGDLATVDDAGYIRIIGRLKRMARVGAEMISLAAVELHAGALWPEAHHAAIAVESPRGGERIVLVTDQADADRHALVQWAKTHGVNMSETPHRIVVEPTLPLLATGKPDYPAVAALYAATDVRPANKET